MTSEIIGYNPFRAIDEFEKRMFREPFAPYNVAQNASIFKTDIKEEDGKFILEADMPGFNKEDIKIDIENDCLTISAERKANNKEEKNNYIQRERFYGSFSRSFDVSGINVDGIEAAYNDGVLTVTLPKKAAEIPASRRLEIK